MLKKFTIIILFALMLFAVTIISYAATTYHVKDNWCVDSGKHLDWSGSTIYSNNWDTGVNTWNNYKSGVIRKYTLLTINDVTISDVSDLSGNTVAYTLTTYPVGGGKGKATIQFSTTKMNVLSQIKRNIVCTHEIGHTLGLSENNDNGTDVIMYNNMDRNTSNNVLHSQDKLNYDYMYNNKY